MHTSFLRIFEPYINKFDVKGLKLVGKNLRTLVSSSDEVLSSVYRSVIFAVIIILI